MRPMKCRRGGASWIQQIQVWGSQMSLSGGGGNWGDLKIPWRIFTDLVKRDLSLWGGGNHLMFVGTEFLPESGGRPDAPPPYTHTHTHTRTHTHTLDPPLLCSSFVHSFALSVNKNTARQQQHHVFICVDVDGGTPASGRDSTARRENTVQRSTSLVRQHTTRDNSLPTTLLCGHNTTEQVCSKLTTHSVSMTTD